MYFQKKIDGMKCIVFKEKEELVASQYTKYDKRKIKSAFAIISLCTLLTTATSTPYTSDICTCAIAGPMESKHRSYTDIVNIPSERGITYWQR